VSSLPARSYGLDPFETSEPESPWRALRRRLAGRYPVDPYGMDPQLMDLAAPLVRTLVRVAVEGGSHLPTRGPAVLVANRGLGIGEPTALAVAVRQVVGRRLRVVGTPAVPVAGALFRRFGAVGTAPSDLSGLLSAGHVVAVPLAPTWLRTGAGSPPLALCAQMMGFPVLPVAITPGGPLHTAVRPWRVRVGAPLDLDASYPAGDPLGAAELGEAVRAAVRQLLAGADPERTPVHPPDLEPGG